MAAEVILGVSVCNTSGYDVGNKCKVPWRGGKVLGDAEGLESTWSSECVSTVRGTILGDDLTLLAEAWNELIVVPAVSNECNVATESGGCGTGA
jgi:hypothetical protein